MAEKKKNPHVSREEAVLKYWKDNNIFKKTLEQKAPRGDFAFYDGPPFATGLPHYGHIVASCLKDVVPRYKTMRGYHVPRRWGWDCHGLPIENIVEKKLGYETKKDILKAGIKQFNDECRKEVLKYAEDWRPVIERLGRFVDMDNGYKTMDPEYMESIWWVFKELWEKEMIYEGYKSMHVCPRCETTLSQYEVTEGYKTIRDISATALFELSDEPGTYLLAWTTTPWTLPGNVALAMNPRIHYSLVLSGGKKYILSSMQAETVFAEKEHEIIEDIDVRSLEGKSYKPLFDYYVDTPFENKENLYTIQFADFVTEEEGTGIVHIAPAFGDDDMRLGDEKKLPFIQHVSLDGTFRDEVKDFAGKSVKPKGDHQSTDIDIIKYLAHKGLLFKKESYEHSYPHCWRCDTPLLNYAKSSWFVKVDPIKKKLQKHNQEINWVPAHIKDGRSGQWYEGVRDWAISRERFWASVMPVWRCAEWKEGDKFPRDIVIGSIAELEELSGQKVSDLHSDVIDEIAFEKDGHLYKRVPEVLDTWFDSGSMPFAQKHYLGKKLKDFDPKKGVNFPAQFIAEGVDQTRAWFYYLNFISTAITGKKSYENVIVNGIVLAEDGQKMSKRLSNYPDPMEIMDTYGADALRLYLMASPVVRAEDLRFSEDGVDQMYKKVINTLWNVYTFYELYADSFEYTFDNVRPVHVLDRWILSKLQVLIETVTESMEHYDLVNAIRPLEEFITELSTWYIRRSRDRFKGDDMDDKAQALSTTHYVLEETSKLLAPFAPFIADALYQKLQSKEESVHLTSWPDVLPDFIDMSLEASMTQARGIIEEALAARAKGGVKVRQPLATLFVTTPNISDELVGIILDEVNVKQLLVADMFPENEAVVVGANEQIKVAIDISISKELQLEGNARELIRQINALRKEQRLSVGDTAMVTYTTDSPELKETIGVHGNEIAKNTLSASFSEGPGDHPCEINGNQISLRIVTE